MDGGRVTTSDEFDLESYFTFRYFPINASQMKLPLGTLYKTFCFFILTCVAKHTKSKNIDSIFFCCFSGIMQALKHHFMCIVVFYHYRTCLVLQ